MSHCWHLYDIFMTHVWHVSDTFLTSFWHDFKTFHQIVSDLILTNVDFLTRLWHVSDIIMTRLCHVYDIFMTRFWHLPFWSENEWNSILIRKRLGMRQLLFDYSGLRKYYTSGFHFRFPLPVSTSGFHFRLSSLLPTCRLTARRFIVCVLKLF